MIEGPLEKGIKFRLSPIDNGTVLDHLPVGSAIKIISLLGLDITTGAATMAINTESKGGSLRKDLLFIENMELTEMDLQKIGLIAHGATWNTVKNKAVVEKKIIVLPKTVRGVLHCFNPNCITNAEPIMTRFEITERPLQATCHYCERSMDSNAISKSIQ